MESEESCRDEEDKWCTEIKGREERGRDGWMKGEEKREEGGGKEKAEGWVGRWWGYDELKMTLSGSLVSKDHSVC